MEETGDNPLVSTIKSTSGLQVVLHPLVLLTISDYITRHAMRKQSGPIMCGLIGQTHGREITIEHAFDCLTTVSPAGDIVLHEEWFTSRLEQMKDVHGDRQLDLVGYSTILPQSGPQPFMMTLHNQVLDNFNESAVLLAFHPTLISQRSTGGNLPLTIYESHMEVEGSSGHSAADGEDHTMKDGPGETTLRLRFSELPYTVETSEAEMISMDHVARSAVAASAISQAPPITATPAANEGDNLKPAMDAKGKRVLHQMTSQQPGQPAVASETTKEVVLNRDEDEMIAALTTKANAVKMLHGRIKLLVAYLDSLPSEFAAGPQAGVITEDMKKKGIAGAAPDYNILRPIQALVNRLPLVVPSDEEAFETELLKESNDVTLVGLLSDLIDSVNTMRGIGRKQQIIDMARGKQRGGHEFGQGGPGGGGQVLGPMHMGGGVGAQFAGDLMGR